MTLTAFNNLPIKSAHKVLENCCGAGKWLAGMLSSRPFEDENALYATAREIWQACSREDGLEAFSHHPKIGDLQSLQKKYAATQAWASQEQAGTQTASLATLQALAEGNKAYESKFGYIFIVCATGKSAEEMLHLLEERLGNKPDEEIKIAMNEQAKITQIRLRKLLE